MSIHNSGNVTIASGTFTSIFTDSENMVQFIKNTLVQASWTRKKVLAGISFLALAITDGDQFTLGSQIFTAYTGAAHGPNPFPVGSNTATNLMSLGNVVQSVLGWTFTTNNFNIITFTVNDTGDPENDGNLQFCQVNPTGTVGQYDFNPNASPGQGITWGGGFTLTSQAVNSTPLILTVVTNNSSTISIWAGLFKNSFEWNGWKQGNQWQIIASRYQFLFYVPMNITAGTFFLGSHLFPSPGLDHCNYCNGPVDPIIPVGGDRASLVSVGNNYYVNAGAEYFTIPSAAEISQPVLSFPGLGSAITPGDKLGNRLAGKDIVNDLGFAIPYEAALVACQSNPSGANPNFSILGYLWDSVVYSGYDLPDNPAQISGVSSIVLLSQSGTTSDSRASLVAALA